MRLRRPSPAMGVALVALFVALGGTGYAAATIGSGQIKNRSIQGIDVANNAISTAKIKDDAVTGDQVKDGSLDAEDLPAGTVNARSITRVTAYAQVPPGGVSGPTVACPAGQAFVSGSFTSAGVGTVFAADTFGAATTWAVGYSNYNGLVPADVTAIVYCAPSSTAVIASRESAAAQRFQDALAARRVDEAAH